MLCFLLLPFTVHSEVVVTDDSGNKISFEKPVVRVISLAPHATELLYAAGADKQVIATVEYSDFPEQAKKIKRIGSYEKIDYEKILELQPQVIVYWKSGNPPSMIDGVKNLNLKVFNNEPTEFEDIPSSIRMLGRLLGTEEYAEQQALNFISQFKALKLKYQKPGLKKVKVFYQVWNKPLMTINHKHLVNDVIEFCGGINVFKDLSNIAPVVDIESVMAKNPDVVIAGMTEGRREWLTDWERWKSINAVKNNHVFAINAELIVRQTPRILAGAKEMCEILQSVRNKINQ